MLRRKTDPRNHTGCRILDYDCSAKLMRDRALQNRRAKPAPRGLRHRRAAAFLPSQHQIAIGLTPSNDGFAHTGGVGGTGIFATASSNVGTGGMLTARVRLSDTTLPIAATVCQTNSSTGQCLSPPSATVTATINQNQNQTWSVFLQANGAVAADPAHNRAFLEFVDAGGVVRGSTSTAVTTQ